MGWSSSKENEGSEWDGIHRKRTKEANGMEFIERERRKRMGSERQVTEEKRGSKTGLFLNSNQEYFEEK